MDDLKEKHRRGTNEIDHPDRAPTGMPYQIAAQQRQQARALQQHQQARAEQHKQEEAAQLINLRRKVAEQLEDDEDSDDSDYDDLLLDDDPVLDAIRQKRLEEMKQVQIKRAEDIAKGHGQYRTISQDEFLPECTGSSEFVAVHFFHKEFERCEIMDHHLKIIAPLHTTCKFLRIDAEKAPFFVSKLQIRTLPTLIIFRDGKAVDRLMGFEGLATKPTEPDKWNTSRLQKWLATTGAIEYNPSAEDLEEEMDGLNLRRNGAAYRGGFSGYDEDY